jgi:hypothetical protein
MSEQGTSEPFVVVDTTGCEFSHGATLRILGDVGDHLFLEDLFGVKATSSHRRGPRSPAYKEDLWAYDAPVDARCPLEDHIVALWQVVRDHVPEILELKQKANVDIFCSYRSDSPVGGIEVAASSLEIFRALDIPFGVSITVLEADGPAWVGDLADLRDPVPDADG